MPTDIDAAAEGATPEPAVAPSGNAPSGNAPSGSAAPTTLRQHVPAPLAGRLLAQVRATSGRSETTRAPLTGEELFTYPLSGEQDVEDAFARAAVAQRAWAQSSAAERAAIVGRVHHMAFDRQDELLDLLALEAGKARYDAFLEVAAVAVYSRYISRVAPTLLARQRRRGIVPLVTKAFELRHPRGVVGLVTAWNYPAVFAASDGFAALAAGNAVVHRPDTQAALSAIWVRSLAVEAGLPEDLWAVLLGPGRQIGTAIIDRADAVAFTGSTAAGRAIAGRTAPRLIYSSLELGGKNPFIVLADADLGRAADAVARACFVNAGQSCVGPERILVQSQVYDQFRERVVARVRRIRVGVSMGFDAEMGSLIDAKQFEAVRRHVDDAVAKGARVLCGGHPLPEIGPFFYAPTVLEGVTEQMAVCAEETFGPVVSLYPFDTVDDAVAMANDTEFGLHAVIWTRDTRAGEQLAARIRAGTVEINDGIVATWGSADLLQGGMKASGMGRRNGHYGIMRFTEPQSVVVQRLHGLHPPGSMGHELFTALMTHSFKAMHRLHRP
jgi:succinate-semialdehyde dehydrogenase/glutarate-semialdehyde dehydrogenase